MGEKRRGSGFRNSTWRERGGEKQESDKGLGKGRGHVKSQGQVFGQCYYWRGALPEMVPEEFPSGRVHSKWTGLGKAGSGLRHQRCGAR